MKLWKMIFVSAVGSLALNCGVQAQDKSIVKILVGFSPGGGADNLSRMLAEKLHGELNQTVIVENKPGAGGRLAAQALKASAPNGRTYLIAPNSSFVFLHLTYTQRELGYDMNKDFTPVAQLTSYPMTLLVHEKNNVNTVADYIKFVKTNPAAGNYGTAGAGGDTHFMGLDLSKKTGVNMQVIPYKGNSPLVVDLVGGQLEAGIAPIGDAWPYIKKGTLKAVGVFSEKRFELAPHIPTVREQGFNTVASYGWMGMWGPANLDVKENKKMQDALKKVLSMPDVKKLIAESYVQLSDFLPSEKMEAQLQNELQHWGPIIKESGFKPTSM